MLTRTKEDVLLDRACDALALAYNPNKPIASDYYIPSYRDVEEAFGFALRRIYGEKSGSSHWADSVRWSTVRNLDQLDKRIYHGVWKAVAGDWETMTLLQHYFSPLHGVLESLWVFLKGNLHRFKEGAREKAMEEFQRFWTDAEKTTWRKIHRFMRQYTKQEFERKSRS